MDQPLFVAQGLNGAIQVYEDRAVLRLSKWAGESGREVPFSQIASIELQDADFSRAGHFRLIFPGAGAGHNPSLEDTIQFDFLNQAFFESAKAFIEAKLLLEQAARQSSGQTASGQGEKCPNCGAPGQPGIKVCGYCGSPMRQSGAANNSNVSIQISVQHNGPMAQSYIQPQEPTVRRKKESAGVILLLIISGIIGIAFYWGVLVDIFGPDSADFVRTAQSELARGRYDQAIESYSRAIEEWGIYDYGFEKEDIEKELKRAQIAGSIEKLQQAMVELREGNLDLARELAAVAHEYDPDNREIEALMTRIDAMIADQ